MLLSEKDAKAICDKLLGHVTADDAVVRVVSRSGSNLRFAGNHFTTDGQRDDVDVRVTVWIDKKKGSASTNETSDDALRSVVEDAERMARISPEDKEYLPSLGPQTYKPVDGYVEATGNIDLAARASAINGVIEDCEKAQMVGAGFHHANGVARAFATKNGNFSFDRSSLVSLSVTARAPDGKSSGYFLRNHVDVAKLDMARIARESIRKAKTSRDPHTLAPGDYTVILEPQAVADLLSYLPYNFDARDADEGRSPFSAPDSKTKIGTPVFDERLNLYSDPWNAVLPGSQAAQDGIPAEKLYLVRRGVLETLIYSRYWAAQKDKKPTPGPVNWILESTAASDSIEDMIKATKKGLLLGRFWYIRMVDPRTMTLTGLTRDGVWYIEDGAIKYPVRNFRFNQSVTGLLAPGNVEMIGASERVGSSESQGEGAMLLPALKVKRFTFTSQSEAV